MRSTQAGVTWPPRCGYSSISWSGPGATGPPGIPGWRKPPEERSADCCLIRDNVFPFRLIISLFVTDKLVCNSWVTPGRSQHVEEHERPLRTHRQAAALGHGAAVDRSVRYRLVGDRARLLRPAVSGDPGPAPRPRRAGGRADRAAAGLAAGRPATGLERQPALGAAGGKAGPWAALPADGARPYQRLPDVNCRWPRRRRVRAVRAAGPVVAQLGPRGVGRPRPLPAGLRRRLAGGAARRRSAQASVHRPRRHVAEDDWL